MGSSQRGGHDSGNKKRPRLVVTPASPPAMVILLAANLATIHRFIPAPYSVRATLVCSEDEDAPQFHGLWLNFAVRCEHTRTKFPINN